MSRAAKTKSLQSEMAEAEILSLRYCGLLGSNGMSAIIFLIKFPVDSSEVGSVATYVINVKFFIT